MNTLKPKEPGIAVMMSFFLAGWGQVYAGRVRRGILFCLASVTFLFGSLTVVCHPYTKLNPSFIALIPLFFILKICVAVDAYFCARNYNLLHRIERKKSVFKTAIMICGGIFFFLVNADALLGFYIRDNIVHPFKITRGGMSPALMPKYRVLVDMSIYKRTQPARGDLVVFRNPKRKGKIHVNRIAGLPGETVEINKGKLWINGKELKESGVLSSTFYLYQGAYGRKDHSYKVPPDSYFVLGDNSRTSYDSRHWGPLPKKDLLGKVYKIYFPFPKSGPINQQP